MTSGRRLRFISACAVGLISSVALSGCGVPSITNPAFSLAEDDARAYLKAQRERPLTLERPLIILAGFQDPGFGARGVERRLRAAIRNPDQMIVIHFFSEPTFDACREKVIDRVDSQFPSNDHERTREVDVLGISMGGLVARYAASETVDDGRKRLRIARLFSIGTPHTGASLAELPSWDQRHLDMRADSDFIRALNDDPFSLDFEIVPYARLGDSIVGVEHTAPPGMTPWWVPNIPFQFAHLTNASDPRILADVVKRLRGETPFTKGEPAPVPEDSK